MASIAHKRSLGPLLVGFFSSDRLGLGRRCSHIEHVCFFFSFCSYFLAKFGQPWSVSDFLHIVEFLAPRYANLLMTGKIGVRYVTRVH